MDSDIFWVIKGMFHIEYYFVVCGLIYEKLVLVKNEIFFGIKIYIYIYILLAHYIVNFLCNMGKRSYIDKCDVVG